MPYDLAISPSGHLYVHLFPDEGGQDTGIQNEKIIQAFERSSAEGLFALAVAEDTRFWPASLHYWRHFSNRYLNCLCQQSVVTELLPIPVPEGAILQNLVLNLPPILGSEYCTVETLKTLWGALDCLVREKISTYQGGLSAFLEAELPHWQQVGKICFHLAENKHDVDYPFAFIVTYASAMGKNAKVQYQPMGLALREYVSAGNTAQLAKLLNPIHEASRLCPWLQDLVESRDIYHPLAWTPEEAYNLLKSVPELEKNGIVVRLPDWWKKRPRPQVKVSIGNTAKKTFTADTLLDFQMELVLGGTRLTEEELQSMLKSKSGLIFLKGQWVEVDSEKLKEALVHWEEIAAEATERGFSFVEGMRLLAGMGKELGSHSPLSSSGDTEWACVQAGDWLKEILQKLRQPNQINRTFLSPSLKTTLRPYQEEGVGWLYFLTELGLGACLADDMGLGKTIQVISLLLIKKEEAKSPRNPSILVLPASLLSNWKAELQRFAPSLKAYYIHASQNNTKDSCDVSLLKGQDIVITTYNMLLRQSWLLAQDWDLVVLDEAQAIKNPATKQSKCVKALKGRAQISLTGTPIENRLGDLWSLFDFLCPGLLGNSTQFNNYLKEIENSETISYAPLRKLVQPYILRRLKTDTKIIDDLPQKTELIAWCGLSKEQAKLYAQSVVELKNALSQKSGIKRKGLVLSFLMRFKQICNHPSQALGDEQYQKEHSGKFVRLVELCEAIASKQEKVLIFTQFREMAEPLSALLSEVFHQSGLILHGGVPVGQRKKLVDEFQREAGASFFILSLKAGGTGLNLTAASHVIHFDRWWNPAVENQATDRAFRIGQKKNVLVHKLICQGTIEEKIDEMMHEKVKLVSEILSAKEEIRLTELDDETLINLISLDIEKARSIF